MKRSQGEKGSLASVATSRWWRLSLLIIMAFVGSVLMAPSPLHTSKAFAADPIVGNWYVTYGAPAVLTISLSSGVYTATALTPVRVTGSSCDLPPGTVIASFSGSGNSYSGQHGLWYTSDCSFGYWDPTSFTLSTDGNSLAGVLGGGYGTVTFTKAGSTTPPIGGPVTDSQTFGPGGSPSIPNAANTYRSCGDPVDCATGNFSESFTDLAVPGRSTPLSFVRTYNAHAASTNGPLGYGWVMNGGMSLTQDASGNATIHEEGGSQVAFTLSNGAYTPAAPRIIASLVKNPDSTFTFTRDARTTFNFNSSGQLTSERDLNGYATTFGYNASGQLSTITDPAGRALTLAWVGSRITSVTDPAGRQVTFAYNDGNGNLTDVTDVNGGVTNVTYDSNHLLLSKTDARGIMVTNAYDSSARVTSQTLYATGLNRTTTWSYSGDPSSAAGGATTVTDPNGNVAVQLYQYGELTWLTKGYGTSAAATWKYAYDPATLGTTSITDPNGHVTTKTYDSRGNLLTVTDPLSRKTINTYDALNDLSSTTDPLGLMTVMMYDGRGNLQCTIRNAQTGQTCASPTVARVSRVLVQRRGAHILFHWRLATSAGVAGFNLFAGTHRLNPHIIRAHSSPNYRYRALWAGSGPFGLHILFADGHQSSVPLGGAVSAPLMGRHFRPLVQAAAAPVSASSAATTYHYSDAAHPGDVTSMTDPKGRTWASTYDSYGDRISTTDPLGDVSTATYNTIGWLLSQTSPMGNTPPHAPAAYTTTFDHNPFGQVTTTTDPLGHQTLRQYDADGNLVQLTDAKGNVTRYAYDLANEQTAVTRPDGTTLKTDYNPDGSVADQVDGAGQATRYAYDSLGRATAVTDPLNRTTNSTYDGAGNLLTVTDPQGQTTTYAYDAANQRTAVTYSDGTTPNVTTIQYDADGQRISMTDGTGPSSWTYDQLNRLTASTDGAGNTVGYQYDLNSNLTGLTYPGGQTVRRGYDSANRLQQVTDWLGNSTTFGYDANSNSTTETLPAATGIIDTASYDQADRLMSITDSHAGSTFASFTYSRDVDNLLNSQSATGVPQPNETYGYSPLNQLRTINTASYGYDAADNITQLTSGATLSYDNGNELTKLTQGTSSTAFGYDQRGNRTSMTPSSGSPTTYTYDQANRLTAYSSGSTAANYVYNGGGLRMSKTVNGAAEPFVWDVAGSLPLLLKDGSTSYVYGPGGQPVEQINSSGTVLWYHRDQLGSTRLLTDASGSVAATYTYDAYGNRTSSTGTVSNPFSYAGGYTDVESGLQYLRARYYDPSTAQFLTRDPVVATTRSPYGYVAGNPLNGVDSSGLCGSWLQNIADAFVQSNFGKAANGWANGVTFGGSSAIEGLSSNGRANLAVDQGSSWFQAGTVAGTLTDAALTAGLGGGAAAADEASSGLGDLGFLNGKVNVKGTLESGASVSRADAVSNAGNFLGPGSTEIAPNVWRSADRLTRFRMRSADHANFEMFNDAADKYPSINFHANYSDWP